MKCPGLKTVVGKLRTSSMPYLYDIAEGNVPGHTPFVKIGYNPAVTTSEEVIWSAGGAYVFPTAAAGMEIVSSDNTQDIGTVIKGDATGNTVQADADGTKTKLEDDSVDFTAGTAVAAGDCVILDPHGTTPEWGYVTAVATNTLTIGNGFSNGGTAASRYYAVIDKSAYTHSQAVAIHYLDGSYVSKEEIVVLNGTTAVATVNTDLFRINYMHTIAAGSSNTALGNISLRNTADTPIYSYITAGYTRERGLIFTVPAGVTVYIIELNFSAATPNDIKVQSARMFLRANMEPHHYFNTGGLLYPYAETVVTNATERLTLNSPIKFIQKTDVEAVGQGFTAYSGPMVAVVRGWIE